MSHVLLVTGGCRSGKSSYAQRRAENLAGSRVFLATCPVVDEEMTQRIQRHRQQRDSAVWQTIEEPLAVAEAISKARQYDTILVDCLTLWVSNLMFQEPTIDEDQVAKKSMELMAAAKTHPGTVIFVTNEVGLGIVPENALARRYRDLIGRCNQTIGRAADEVVFMCCGLPLTVKG
jgi:adenosylcobinamide kinase / adenosylcobinamide-phosphate guanylyltransferase